jgi:hypothetical protein
MVSFKTPKSSTTKVRTPGTPTKPTKPKKGVPAKKIVKKPPLQKKTKLIETKLVETPALEATKVKKKRARAACIPTAIDDVDTKLLPGQHSRTHKWAKACTLAACERSTNGLVDTSIIPNFVAPDRDEEQLAFLVAKAPMHTIRFAKLAIDHIRLLMQNAFTAKIKDLKFLNTLTGKQTLSLAVVWTERQLRSMSDLTSAMNLKYSSIDVETSMLEDMRQLCTRGSKFSMSEPVWNSFVGVHGAMDMHTDDDHTRLSSAADALYGSEGVWSVNA